MRRTITTIAALLMAATAFSQVENISTRGRVGIFDDVLIAGFILKTPTTVVVRALGPSLIPFGVTDTLPDPILAVYNGNDDLIALNDDWQTDFNASKLGVLAPSNEFESAMVLTLPAGHYTAIVCGYSMTEGKALVEVYEVSP